MKISSTIRVKVLRSWNECSNTLSSLMNRKWHPCVCRHLCVYILLYNSLSRRTSKWGQCARVPGATLSIVYLQERKDPHSAQNSSHKSARILTAQNSSHKSARNRNLSAQNSSHESARNHNLHRIAPTRVQGTTLHRIAPTKVQGTTIWTVHLTTSNIDPTIV